MLRSFRANHRRIEWTHGTPAPGRRPRAFSIGNGGRVSRDALRKRLAGGAGRPEAGPGRSSGLFAPLVPGAAHGGSGGRLGDAIVFALGAALAGGLALVAAGPVGDAIDAGAAVFVR